jgi:hypothetical protein
VACTEKTPTAEDAGTEIVIDWLAPAAMVNGAGGCVLAPEGNPEIVTVTEPVNPSSAATERRTAGLVLPRVALISPGDIVRVKSPTGGGEVRVGPVPQPATSPRVRITTLRNTREVSRELKMRHGAPAFWRFPGQDVFELKVARRGKDVTSSTK